VVITRWFISAGGDSRGVRVVFRDVGIQCQASMIVYASNYMTGPRVLGRIHAGIELFVRE